MLPEDSGSAKQPFDLDQVKALVRSADGDWKGAIMVALYTGARLRDLVNMRWESIDLQNKWITFRASKTRQRSKVPIKIPMHEALYDFLLELPASDSGKSLLFPSLAVKGTGGRSVFRWRLAALWSEQRCAEKWRESAPVKRGAQSIL